MSELLKILGCRYPIIQGPIGMLNSPKMVAAVSEAGAYDMLALGFSNPDEVKKLVDEVRKLTDKPFGANIMLINPQNENILKILAQAGVKAVTTSVGSPKEIYPIIHDMGMKGIHVVLALQHAIRTVSAEIFFCLNLRMLLREAITSDNSTVAPPWKYYEANATTSCWASQMRVTRRC